MSLDIGRQKYFTVSIDMDNLDVLLDAYNIEVEKFDRTLMYKTAVCRLLELLDRLNVRATFFVLGKCCECDENVAIIRDMVSRGHEIANHSYSHKENYDITDADIIAELELADRIIRDRIKVDSVGYRAPGYQITRQGIRQLEKMKYRYDASLMPSLFIATVWIAIYLKTLKKRNRPLLRRFYHVCNPGYPFRIKGTQLIEIPCPTRARILPFLPTFDFALPYLQNFTMTKLTSHEFFTFQGHALDFFDVEEDKLPPRLRDFHPGMALTWKKKSEYFEKHISKFLLSHKPVTFADYIDEHDEKFRIKPIVI